MCVCVYDEVFTNLKIRDELLISLDGVSISSLGFFE